MLKNKLKIISLLIIVTLCLIMPTAKAENETTNPVADNSVTETTNEATNESTNINAENTTEYNEFMSESSLDNMKKEDVYIIDT